MIHPRRGIPSFLCLVVYVLLHGGVSCFVFGRLGARTESMRLFGLSERIECSSPFTDIRERIFKPADPVGLYIHIPYCRRRCHYCDFAIVPIGPDVETDCMKDDAGISKNTKGFRKMDQLYVSALLNEIRHIRVSSNATKIDLKTVYFGGGTPSLAPMETIESLVEALWMAPDSPFRLQPEAEVTMEMDPGTFSESRLMKYHSLGINRISLGVQSFDDSILESLGRVHRRKDIFESIRMIGKVFVQGVPPGSGQRANYSIDLISGLPGLTLAKWVETLSIATKALDPSPLHMSVYDLQVEAGTVFGKRYAGNVNQELVNSSSSSSLPTEEESAFMYKYAAGYLRSKGWEHYEVSSYARMQPQSVSPCRSGHNQIYWEPDGQWFAIGLGSTSSIRGHSVVRPRALSDYVEWSNELSLQKGDYAIGDFSAEEFLTDTIMKRLRTSDGLDLDWVSRIFGEKIAEEVIQGTRLGLDSGLAQIHQESPGSKGVLRLSDPDGLLYSNYLISSIFADMGYG